MGPGTSEPLVLCLSRLCVNPRCKAAFAQGTSSQLSFLFPQNVYTSIKSRYYRGNLYDDSEYISVVECVARISLKGTFKIPP